MKTHNRMKLIAFLGCFLIASAIASTTSRVAAADGGLNLPSNMVRIEVFNGTDGYFDTKLSKVPSGYDVTNATYLGWCIDIKTEMSRSPALHDVMLYSSLDPPNGSLANQRWDMVNYVLNHKQGNASNVQDAIWYFIDFNNGSIAPPQSDTVTWAIINDASTNGTNFVPAQGQIVAVICDPIYFFSNPVQVSIIELANPVIPEFSSLVFPFLFAIFTVLTVVVYRKRKTGTLSDA